MTEKEIEEKQIKQQKKFYHQYWKHYISLEKRVFETERYVTINESNFNTFSIEYDILLQAICSEIDVISKRLCKEYDKNSHDDDMSQYIERFIKYDNIADEIVLLDIYDLKFTPWSQIKTFRRDNPQQRNCPSFWNCYNKVKHNRVVEMKSDNEFTEIERNITNANLKNVLNALAALYVLETRCMDHLKKRFDNLFKNIGSPLECGVEFPEKSIFTTTLGIWSGF